MSHRRIYGVMLYGAKVCVLFGFYSCCIFKYDCIVCMVHSINSRGVSFNYCIHESMCSIVYGVIHTVYIYKLE